MLKLAKDPPSWTIQAQPGSAIGPIHWSNRKLTAHEMCRLQTFPDGLNFDCGRSDVQKLLGNAVPSLLAEVFAREIRHQLLGDERHLGPPQLILGTRSPVPASGPVASVPARYHDLIGAHPDHPGERRLSRRRHRVNLGSDRKW